VRSRVVSASEAVITIALAAGFLLGGPALELLGPRGVYAVGGTLGLFGAIVLVPILRSSRRAHADAAVELADPSPARRLDEPELARTGG
jgi:predicted MFS family arabinose efflux permease